ncbi:MAG TPA: universal stress protein [Actinomycetota bacterium]|nr:universal stress protein [Actinomycetota bacterium]
MKVLHAADGLEAAEEARRLMKKLFRREGLEVTVVSVTSTGLPSLGELPYRLDPKELRRPDSVAIVDAAVEDLRGAGFSVSGRVCEGDPATEVLHLIERDWFDVTVIGTGHHTWMGAHLLGSVSTNVLHSSPSSVLMVHKIESDDEVARVLVATDGSRGSDQAVQWLSRIIDPELCTVTVLSVAPDLPTPVMPPLVPLMAEADDRTRHAMEARASQIAGKAVSALNDLGFKAEPKVVSGSPVEQVLEEATAVRYDLVAVGTRGMGAVHRTMIGSVSDQITRHAGATFVARRLTH